MRLYELTGVKRYHKYTKEELLRILSKFGIKIVDGGTYGSILTSDKWNYVVKMFAHDPYYLSFVDFVKKHPNVHYPKIGRMPLEMHVFYQRPVSDADKIWLLKIEKLLPINKTLGQFIVRNMDKWMQIAYYLHTEATNQASKDCLDEVNPRLEFQQPDGTIVIIDPLWEGSNPYKEYDAWYRCMADTGGADDYYVEPTTSGPTYKHHEKEKLLAKEKLKNVDDDDYDIPF